MGSSVANFQRRKQVEAPQVEKATRQIIIGHTREGNPIKIWIGDTLHSHLTAIIGKTHGEYRHAYLMSAERGAPIVRAEVCGGNVIESDSEGAQMGPVLRAAIDRVIKERRKRGFETSESEAQEIGAEFLLKYAEAAAFVTGEDLKGIGRERK